MKVPSSTVLKHLPQSICQLEDISIRCVSCIAFIDTAMLMSTLWSAFGSLMGLFYAGMQVMVPCLPPAPLSISRLNTDEVRGFKVIVFIHTLHVSITV